MHLVDLAGSERVEKSEVKGERLRETQYINKSLSALGDVIACLAQKSAHVPYRNSKLTQLLQDSLGGQAKTLMFVHVSPEAEALGETVSTLKFAERVASVELGAARVNRDCGEVRDLKEQIAALKMELERKGSAELEEEFEELQIKKPNYKRAEDLQSLEEEAESGEWIDKAVVNNSKGRGGGDEEAVKEMRRAFYADDSDHSSAAGESSKLRRPQAKGIKSMDGIGRNLSHASRNGSTQMIAKTTRSGGIKK